MKKISALIFAVFFTVLGVSAVYAADQAPAVKQCITDNASEGQTPAVVEGYCTCMSKVMPATEKATITEWEKAHKAESDDCSKKAGWAGSK